MREDWKSAAQMIQATERSNETIVIFPEIFQNALEYYYGGDLDTYPLSLDLQNFSNESVKSELCNVSNKRESIWLVIRFHGGEREDSESRLKQLIEERSTILEHEIFSEGIEVFHIQDSCT
jgi:hypothetical protein